MYWNKRGTSKVLLHSAILHIGHIGAAKLREHVTEDIPNARAKFCSNLLKILSDEKSNDGSDTDNCAEGETTKCYSVFTAKKCSR